MDRAIQIHTTIHTPVMAHDSIAKNIYYLSILQQYCR